MTIQITRCCSIRIRGSISIAQRIWGCVYLNINLSPRWLTAASRCAHSAAVGIATACIFVTAHRPFAALVNCYSSISSSCNYCRATHLINDRDSSSFVLKIETVLDIELLAPAARVIIITATIFTLGFTAFLLFLAALFLLFALFFRMLIFALVFFAISIAFFAPAILLRVLITKSMLYVPIANKGTTSKTLGTALVTIIGMMTTALFVIVAVFILQTFGMTRTDFISSVTFQRRYAWFYFLFNRFVCRWNFIWRSRNLRIWVWVRRTWILRLIHHNDLIIWGSFYTASIIIWYYWDRLIRYGDFLIILFNFCSIIAIFSIFGFFILLSTVAFRWIRSNYIFWGTTLNKRVLRNDLSILSWLIWGDKASQDAFKWLLRRIRGLLKEAITSFIAIGGVRRTRASWTRLTYLVFRDCPIPSHTTMRLVMVWIRVTFVAL